MAKRFQQIKTLTERLGEFAQNARDEAKRLEPGGPERQALLEKARKADATSELKAWVNSPGLQRPK
ncbi:hypothetical protein [Nitrobacter hamburgensis]|nr:hypothetical protein [Nitrobacter hamburgensis]